MSSNRPLFDDEDLPAWLRKAGITGGSHADADAGETGESSGDAIDMSWLDDVSDAPAAAAEPLPWQAASAAPASAPPGDFAQPESGPLPWEAGSAQGEAETASPAPAAAPLAALPWEAPGEPPAVQAPIDLSLPFDPGAGDDAEIFGEPVWDAGVDWTPMPDDAAAPPETMPAATGDEPLPWDAEPASDDLSWLQEPAGESAAPATPVGPQEDWLADFMGETAPAAPAAPAEETADAWINEPLPTEDWLRDLESAPPGEPEPETSGAPPEPASDDWLASFRDEVAAADFLGEAPSAEPAAPEPWSAPESEPSALGDDWLRELEGEPPADLGPLGMVDEPLSFEAEPGAAAEPDAAFDEEWLAGFLSRSPAEAPPEPEPLAAELPDLEVPDWFADVPAPSETSAPADAGALDWMAELPPGWQESTPETPDAPVPVDAVPAPPDEDALDWMREQEVGQPEMSAPEPAAPEPALPAPLDVEPASIPDWMQSIAPAGTELPADVGAEPADSLDWMSAAESPASPEAPLAEAEIPAWMQDIAPAAPTPMARPVEDQETAAALDWLAEVDEADIPPQAPAAQPPQPVSPFSVEPSEYPISESGELITDLSSADIDALLHLPPSELEPEPPAPSGEVALVQTVDLDSDALDLDEILGPEEPSAEPGLAAAAAAAELASAEIAPDASREHLPGWIEKMQPSEVPVVIQVGDQKVRIAEKPVAQLDPQLQKLRDRSRDVSAEAKRLTEVPSSGPLSGISDAIIPAPDQIPAATAAVTGMIIDDLEARRVRVLESLLGAQEEQMRRHVEQDQADAEAAQPSGRRARRRARSRTRARFKLDRLIVTVILALAVVAPFFTDALNLFEPLSFEALSPEDGARIDTVGAAVDLIQPANPYVLVAFEFRPTGASEMDDLAVAVLRDVWRRGGIPVVVSTDPSGAVHAQGLIARLANETATLAVAARLEQPLLARQDYVVLGFVPGGAAGVRMLYDSLQTENFQRQFMLNIDIEGRAAGLDDSARDTLRSNPVFLLAEGQDDVRNWAEQFRPRGGSDGPSRLILLSSVGASAIAQTYAKTDPVRFGGPLVGLRDATLYYERRSLHAGADDSLVAARRWQSVGLAATAAAVIVLFGAAVNGIRSLRRMRRTRR